MNIEKFFILVLAIVIVWMIYLSMKGNTSSSNIYTKIPTEFFVQTSGDPTKEVVIKDNLQVIQTANDMEQKKKAEGAPTICVFIPNKFLPYRYEDFIKTFTGLILPFSPSPVPIQTENVKLVDFSKIPEVSKDRAVFYGVAPKLFNKARDQGPCGSCWAYSGVTAIEAQVVKKYLVENPAYVSIQYYVDCVKECKGCEGGFPLYVYEQIARDGFVVWDDFAPYIGVQNDICAPPKEKFPVTTSGTIVFGKNGNAGYFDSKQFKEAFDFQELELKIPSLEQIENLKKILFNYGPLSALIYVDDKLPYFSSGIYKTVDTKDGKKQNPNHAIVIGGYGINVYGETYWVIRNSWGSEWGEDGYVPLSMDSPISGINIPLLDLIPPTL
jgi:C1A family cysteine protease